MNIKRWESGPDPSISVVVPTIPSTNHNNLIDKFKNQTFEEEWEVLIIVDDAPTDRRCEARNTGLKKSDANIVAHTDDDVKPPDDWISNIYMKFEPNTICVEGQVRGGMTYSGVGLYRGCNMAVRSKEALRVGGWNEEYVGWRDDTEFGWRLEKQGNGDCIYSGDVRMEHPPNPRTSVKMDQELKLYDRYPNRYQDRIPDTLAKTACLTAERLPGGAHIAKSLTTLL